MDLRNFEYYEEDGTPVIGASVALYVASDAQPNPGSVLATDLTDTNGMWEFTGLDNAAAYDIKVTIVSPVPHVRWYKGNARVSILGLNAPNIDTRQSHNYVINGDFQVWQRPTIPTTDNAYVSDRWRLLLGAANAFTVLQETSDVPTDGGKSGLRLTVGAGNNNKGGIWTILEGKNIKSLRNKRVSLQVKLKATAALANTRVALVEWVSTEDAVSGDPISAWDASASNNPSLVSNFNILNTPVNLGVTTEYVTYKFENLLVGNTANNLAVFIWSNAVATTTTTDILRVFDVHLNEGPVCLGVERPDYSEALLRCQRYFTRIDENGASGVRALAWGSAISATAARVYVVWPTTMRGIPSVAFNGTKSQYAILTSGAGFAGTVSNVATLANSPHIGHFEVTTSAGLVAGNSTALVASGATAAFLEASAEL